jgi:hypothetical protein
MMIIIIIIKIGSTLYAKTEEKGLCYRNTVNSPLLNRVHPIDLVLIVGRRPAGLVV